MATKKKSKLEFIPEGKRKITMAIYGLITIVVAAGIGFIDGAQFIEGIKWIVGLFMGGNAMEHTSKSGGGLLGPILGRMGISPKPKK